jgi:hypothetical protein
MHIPATKVKQQFPAAYSAHVKSILKAFRVIKCRLARFESAFDQPSTEVTL